ncbi:MAG: zeta toxin family protein [Bacteroidetes bacterium]|nr:zeta toxin family protein [Bacteroidota bacterium]
MRVFAGPNGSGKSAVYELVRRQYRIGRYINADEIELVLSEKGFLHLEDFGLQISRSDFEKYLSETPFLSKSLESGLGINLRWSENVLVCSASKSNSYEAAFVAEMLRLELIRQGITFSFETVMSHPAKLDIFQRAHDEGYRSYLYFVCTQDPSINIERIRNRVSKGGHPVPEDKVESRYFRSLKILAPAAMAAYRSYLFDNSGEEARLIAEMTPEKKIILHDELIPNWVNSYFLEKLA